MPRSGLRLWLVDCPALFGRPGGPYRGPDGAEWPDNARRFALFCRAAAIALDGVLPGSWRSDVVHANDWHTGLLLALLQTAGDRRPVTVFTIHNLAYQGLFPPDVLPELGLRGDPFTPDGIEFHGRISFHKAGIRYADRVTTVSPTYAREILCPELGSGLDGLLRHRRGALSGILNGVDTRVWDPRTDPHIAAHYSLRDLSGKRACKEPLRRELGLDGAPEELPLLAFVGRLAHQKMADVVLDALPAILACGVQLTVLGDGDRALEVGFEEAARRHPGRIAARAYDEALAHRVLAGADMLLHPSRFEPCGLTPLYALRYGTVPVVPLPAASPTRSWMPTLTRPATASGSTA